MTPLRYIRAHPFSTMAFCNILGDLGYLGFAFAAQGFVSLPKLFGAAFALLAHCFLLAYGDKEASKIRLEHGNLSRFILRVRAYAKKLTIALPTALQSRIRQKPVGVTFSMLALNGLGLFLDAFRAGAEQGEKAFATQAALGILITFGCLAFAAADFVKRQTTANQLTKAAPTLFTCASLANVGLMVATWNPFIVLSVLAFAISNVAGFYTNIDKSADT